jgi:hypothetical protein
MSINTGDADAAYGELLDHVGHEIACVTYGDGANVAIECETCGTVLLDADKPGTEVGAYA